MILFQQSAPPEYLPPTLYKYIYIRIVILMCFRLTMLIFNLLYVNTSIQKQLPKYIIAALLPLLQVLAFVMWKSGVLGVKIKSNEESGGGSSSETSHSFTQASSVSFADYVSEDENQQKHSFCKKLKNQFKNALIWPNLFWHWIMWTNTIIIIFSIFSCLESVLSSFLHKVRSPLYLCVFYGIVSVAYFLKNPYFTQNKNSQFEQGKQNPNYIIILKNYEHTEIQFAKLLFLFMVFGSFTDFFLYGTSDIVDFNQSLSDIQFNQMTMIVFSGLLLIYLAWYFYSKHSMMVRAKELWDCE